MCTDILNQRNQHHWNNQSWASEVAMAAQQSRWTSPNRCQTTCQALTPNNVTSVFYEALIIKHLATIRHDVVRHANQYYSNNLNFCEWCLSCWVSSYVVHHQAWCFFYCLQGLGFQHTSFFSGRVRFWERSVLVVVYSFQTWQFKRTKEKQPKCTHNAAK